MVGLQNLRRQLLHRPEISDGFLLGHTVLYLHIDMLGIFIQNVLLLPFLQHLQMSRKLCQKCFLTHCSSPSFRYLPTCC